MSRVSVVITTKDRVSDLATALESVALQSAAAELVVVDDGSTDGTSDYVAKTFPEAILIRNESPRGVIGARNQGVSVASGDIVLILDDDAVLENPRTLEALPSLFEPGVAVVALPLVNVVDGVEPNSPPPAGAEDQVTCAATFSAGAAALLKAPFDELGGFRGVDRQGEEGDFSLRLLNRGLLVRLAPRYLSVRHYPRHRARLSGYILESAARNRFVSVIYNTPTPVLPAMGIAVAANYLRIGLLTSSLGAVVRGLADGVVISWVTAPVRQPVAFEAYRLHRRLVRHGPLPLSEIRHGVSALARRQA